MMAGSSKSQEAFIPISVIGTQFVTSDSFQVILDKFSNGNLVITDTNHKILLKLKPCNTSFHQQRMLLDANDQPIVMLRRKYMSAYDQWNVFRGESKSESDMIFSTKTEHMIKFKTCVKVFLGNKMSSNKDCDFKLKGSWSKKKCSIYLKDSSTAIAQMHAVQVQPIEKSKFAKNKFMVTINPNIDYAFVIAVVAIVDAMKSSGTKDVYADEFAGTVGAAIGSAVASYVTS